VTISKLIDDGYQDALSNDSSLKIFQPNN